jgi:chorismate-pyruvate lyase
VCRTRICHPLRSPPMKLVANRSSQLREGGPSRLEDRLGDDRLTERHFTMQHTHISELTSLEVVALDPQLRGLLFTDGTVTRALEAQTLCHVAVDVVEQSQTKLPAQAAHYLDVNAASSCLRRRVTMTTGESSGPVVWAESHILPERLPTGFLGLLDNTPHGIGGSIEQTKLESRRELLWFRLGRPPSWAGISSPSDSAVIRLYRIITGDRPALLISEAFAVELRAGVYRPLGWSGAAGHAVNESTLSSPE